MGSGLLDILGLAATAQTKMQGAREEGLGLKREADQKSLMARLAQDRQAALDAQNAERNNLLNELTKAQTEKMTAPPAAPEIQWEYDEERGGYTAPGQPFQPVQGLPARPKPVVTPQVPVRGTPEYNAMLEAEARARATGGGGERGAQLPAAAIEKMIDLDDIIGMTKRARTSLAGAVREGRDVTGRVGGVLPVKNWIRNMVGQGGEVGTGVRAELANVSSSIMKLRSGAAVSDQEFARLEPFLASDDDDESVAMIKLRKLAQALEEMKRIRLENYQRYGKRGMEQTRGVDPETGVDMDEAIDAVLGRQP